MSRICSACHGDGRLTIRPTPVVRGHVSTRSLIRRYHGRGRWRAFRFNGRPHIASGKLMTGVISGSVSWFLDNDGRAGRFPCRAVFSSCMANMTGCALAQVPERNRSAPVILFINLAATTSGRSVSLHLRRRRRHQLRLAFGEVHARGGATSDSRAQLVEQPLGAAGRESEPHVATGLTRVR
jgi:hypothetical protein